MKKNTKDTLREEMWLQLLELVNFCYIGAKEKENPYFDYYKKTKKMNFNEMKDEYETLFRPSMKIFNKSL